MESPSKIPLASKLKGAALIILGLVLLISVAGAGGALAAVALVTNTHNKIDTDEPEGIEALSVVSKQLGETMVLQVMPPIGYGSERGQDYGVLWVLDGRRQADHMFKTAQTLTLLGLAEPVIVVAVPSSSAGRHVDFMPPDAAFAELAGHGDRFLAFLEDEARPALEAEYPCRAPHLLAGHSLGGLFAGYALVEGAGYDAYLAASPSWWAGEQAAVPGLAERAGSDPHFFYASVGEREGSDMKAAFAAAEDASKTAMSTGSRWHFKRTPHADHGSNPKLAAAEALRAFWAGWQAPSE